MVCLPLGTPRIRSNKHRCTLDWRLRRTLNHSCNPIRPPWLNRRVLSSGDVTKCPETMGSGSKEPGGQKNRMDKRAASTAHSAATAKQDYKMKAKRARRSTIAYIAVTGLQHSTVRIMPSERVHATFLSVNGPHSTRARYSSMSSYPVKSFTISPPQRATPTKPHHNT